MSCLSPNTVKYTYLINCISMCFVKRTSSFILVRIFNQHVVPDLPSVVEFFVAVNLEIFLNPVALWIFRQAYYQPHALLCCNVSYSRAFILREEIHDSNSVKPQYKWYLHCEISVSDAISGCYGLMGMTFTNCGMSRHWKMFPFFMWLLM